MKTLIIYDKHGKIIESIPTFEEEIFNIICDIPINKKVDAINVKKKKPIFEDSVEIKSEKDRVLNELDKVLNFILYNNKELTIYKKKQLKLENEYVQMVINSL